MRKICFLIVVLFVFSVPVLAQDWITVELPDGYTVDVPDDFEMSEDPDTGVITLSDGETSVDVFLPDFLDQAVDFTEYDTDSERLAAVVTAMFEFEEPDIVEVTSGKTTLAGWNWEITEDDVKGTSYLIPLAEDTFALLDIYAPSAIYDDSLDLYDEIAVSMRSAEEPKEPSEAAATCLISTDDDDTVQLRVGPGENRSVISFLPSKTEFIVTGSFNDDDDNLWFQLDKSEVDPDSPAAELWVLAADVDTTEGCDQVASVNAPPIVPASNRPATTDSGSTTTNTQSGGAAGIVNGLWTLYYGGTTNASCAGGQNQSFPTSEISGLDMVQENVLDVQNGRISATADLGDGTTSDAVFTVNSPGNYTLSFTYRNGINSQLYLSVVSSTSMVGQEIINFTIDGTPCSGTIPVSASPS